MSVQTQELPQLVVGIILSNIGVIDLLNCRLVSKVWNSECLKLLKKCDKEICLTVSNINDFIESMLSLKILNPILPIHLTLTNYQPVTRSSIQRLLAIAYPCYISTLKLEFDILEDDDIRPVVLLLRDLSLSVVRIYISSTIRETLIEETRNMLNDYNVQFNRIEYVKCDCRYTLDDGTLAKPNFFYLIVERCLHVKKLIVNERVGSNGSIVPYEKIKYLSFNFEESQECINRIKKSIMLPTKLKLFQSNRFHFQVLKEFAPNLTSLTIPALCEGSHSYIHPFPKLPSLTFLKLMFTVNGPGGYIYVNPHSCNFNPNFFPKLQTVNIPTGFYFYNTSSKTDIDPEQFFNVKYLTVCQALCDIDEDSRSFWPSGARSAFENGLGNTPEKNILHLQHMFPRVFTLELDFGRIHSQQLATPFLNALLRCDGSKNIGELILSRMTGCNYFGHVVQNTCFTPSIKFLNYNSKSFKRNADKILDDTVWLYEREFGRCSSFLSKDGSLTIQSRKKYQHKMTNLVSITIGFLHDKWSKGIEKKPCLHIGSLVAGFKTLQTIKLNNSAYDKTENMWNRLRDYKMKYPTCSINFI